MSGVIQASNSATSGANAANQSGASLPPWLIAVIVLAGALAAIKLLK